ncbi:NRPS-like enzyme protein [Rutstroemia sp. NJR-2017a WRK4]|nr:NRPS-like enzyme protein [Rutstroemia sp. NJR-2017a WRK4]
MAHLTPAHIQHLYETFGELRVLDDIIRHRAKDNPPAPILGYPKIEDDVNVYESFTGQQLDLYVDRAVKYFLEQGLKPNQKRVVGIYAPSNVHFLVTFFALSRLGYTVLCLSLRIAPVAIINLLKQTNCDIIIRGDTQAISSTIAAVAEERPSLKDVIIPTRATYEAPRPAGELPFTREFDREVETNEIALVMHSSGSTGLPKPVALSHKNVLTHPVQGAGMDNFGALPLYHMYGLSTTLQAMYMAKIANLPSATVPMTADTLMAAIEATQPDVIHAVPYALGLIAEHPRGMAYLKSAKIVTAAGARTPDELGDRLVEEGVNVGVVFGTTEAGLLGDTMRRKDGDNSWNYVRIYSNIRESIYMDPLGDNQFECVYLKSHPGLSVSNSDDPAPGSWRSKDVFEPHPTIPDTWKYVTRLDDRVTLSNGEKVLPLPIEGCIRSNELVREAVVVGVDRSIPGVLVFRASEDLSDEEFLEAVWPTIVDANTRAEQFSQITKDMVTIMPADVEYPRTDKGSIIRAQCYRKFAKEIDEMYERLEGESEGTLKLDLAGIETFLTATYEDIVGGPLESLDTDFFNAGIDSLRAIQMRRIIQKTLYLNGKQLSSNVVYEHGHVRGLAKFLHSIGQGVSGDNEDKTPLMRELIQKYSNFGEVVILTGATGSLGAHTLAQMVNGDGVRKVYCLVRGADPMGRVMKSLKERGLKLDAAAKAKIVAFTSDLALPDLGLGQAMMEQFKTEVSLIIHLAWSVNFIIGLQSFEPHLAGLRNLLNLSLSVYRSEPARIYYASSISTAENTPAPAVIPDAPIEDFNNALNMGYAQSKLVGEHMVLNAARGGARAYALRIGQIVGDRENGVWNEAEFIPSMIRSALTMKALPILHENCSWIPVDTLATAILEVDQTVKAGPRPNAIDMVNPPVIYNMVNPDVFSWAELLHELDAAGLDFKAMPFGDWLQRLRESAASGNEAENPAVKLLDHFEQRYLQSTNGNTYASASTSSSGAGTPTSSATSVSSKSTGISDFEDIGVSFDTKAVLRDSEILRQPPNIIKDGYVKQFLSSWMSKWVRN